MKILYLVLITLLALVLVILFLDIMIGYVLFHRLFARNGRIKTKQEKQNRALKTDEIKTSDMTRLEITSSDGIKLVGLYRDDKNSKAVILAHGYGQSKEILFPWCKLFQSLGFDQLVIDMRAHGESGGDETLLGYKESDDILLWIQKLKSIKPEYEIVLFGLGIGGAAIVGQLDQNDPSIKALILDSCYDNALRQIKYFYSNKKIKIKLFFNIFFNYLKRNKNINIKNIDNCEKLKKSKIPVLILHGENDKITPVEMAYDLYASLPDKLRNICVFKDSGHFENLISNKYLYKNEIKKFLIKYNL